MQEEQSQELHPQIIINTQYVKDLSFENPNAPMTMNSNNVPKLDVNIDLAARKLNDEMYEVSLNIVASAAVDDHIYFVTDLTYAGLFSLLNAPEDQLEFLLFVHCPNLLFPFARRVIADVTRDGGFQPLMINPIDFYQLYFQKKQAETPSNSESIN